VDQSAVGRDGVALSAYGLTKRYRLRGRPALQDVEVEVPTGSITALVGPNGAGKTTLLRTWVGFERPSRGHVLVRTDDPWTSRKEAISSIAYVPQSHALYRGLSVGDHIELARSLRPGFDVASARSRIQRLRIVLDQQATTLSGGQRAQVLLAIGLATRAPILILDEPLATLDPLARREFLSVLQSAVFDDGRTAVLSSHIVSDIEAVCDRIVMLVDGRVRLNDTIARAVGSHSVWPEREAPTATFVGTFPIMSGAGLTVCLEPPAGLGRAATLEEVVMAYLAASEGQSPPLGGSGLANSTS
jgi:ABC-2 type transport system ATP-binding protein